MSKLSREAYLVFALQLIPCALMPVAGWAQATAPTANAASSPEQAQRTPAGKFIQDLGNNALGVIKDKSLTQTQRSEKYDNLLRSAFDLKTIGHFVVGRAWDAATPEQRQEYMQLFEKLVVKTYGDRMKFYSGESFRVTSVRSESEKDFMVSSEIVHLGGQQPTRVDWRVRQDNGKLAIIDVIVDGVSQSVTQRQEYASIIERDNGKLDKLLTDMRQRLQGQGTQPENSNPQ
ncbi:MAG: ABC transporter substrate-binding protein [Alphaproteobacteria bacterium]|nr:ABC transporter substrate-binding protein [Alphaproteobacteria bacterium]